MFSDGRKVPATSLCKRAFDSASSADMVDGIKVQWESYLWPWEPRMEGVASLSDGGSGDVSGPVLARLGLIIKLRLQGLGFGLRA